MAVTDLTGRLSRAELAELGQQLRVDAIRAAAAAGSGHPTSAMSAADLMAVLLAGHLRYDLDDPDHPHNDHLIFSKGHASPLLYAMLRAAGAITEPELLSYRSQGSRLEGHPVPGLPLVDVATGSLGQGLPIGVGLALAGARLDRLPYRVWVLCGDSELAEGSMWEAIEHAGHARLDRLVAVVDVNRLGQRGPTRYGWDTATYARRFGAFGWRTIEIDGHDLTAIDDAYRQATEPGGRPTAILARTRKGRGVPEVEDQEGRHGKVLSDPEEAVRRLGGRRDRTVAVARPPAAGPPPPLPTSPGTEPPPAWRPGQEEVATRTAFGTALVALGHIRGDVVVLDGEVADSTRTEYFAAAYPERFFQCYIAEQQLVAAAVGMQVRGWRPYLASFAAFLSRAHDFLRMAAIGQADLCVVGSHAGVEIGPDGPSQMGLEDLAMFRALPGSTVLYPSDGNQTAQLVAAMADHPGITYLRTTRGDTPVIYQPGEEFPIGGSRVLRGGTRSDRVTIAAAGVTVHLALVAADRLAEAGIPVRVIDLYSVKPVDAEALRAAARDTGRIVTVEDHRPEGGLGDAVLDVFADGSQPPSIHKLAVRSRPGSATPAQQLAAAGLDPESIAAAAQQLVSKSWPVPEPEPR
jgi:transketolase